MSYHRPTLTVKFGGEKVLVARWTIDGFTRRSYAAGRWERILHRYDQALASRVVVVIRLFGIKKGIN